MALSSSTDFILSALQIIESALAKVGGYVIGETLNADVRARALQELNVLLKALQNRGLYTHLRKSISITPVASQASYTLGPSGADVTVARPLKIIQVELKKTSDSSRTSLTANTHDEFMSLNSRDVTTGNPTQYLYEDLLTSGKLTFYPIPDSTTASDYTLEAIYRKPLDDLDTINDNLEIPPNWYMAIIYNLAESLAFEYPLSPIKWNKLTARAREYLQEAETSQQEQSIQFEPDWE